MNRNFQPQVLGLVFDMDGLIFDSERVVRRSWEWAGKELGFECLGEHIYNTIGFNLKTREEYFKNNVAPDFPMEEFTALTRKRYRQIINVEGLAKKPGVRELLEYASTEGCRIGLATSSRRDNAIAALKEQGLWDYFDGAVFGDMVAKGKPNPEIYLKACQEIGVLPENALALEDAPSGIRSATSAGMRAIIIPDLVEPSEDILNMAWRRYDTLFDVLRLLKEG